MRKKKGITERGESKKTKTFLLVYMEKFKHRQNDTDSENDKIVTIIIIKIIRIIICSSFPTHELLTPVLRATNVSSRRLPDLMVLSCKIPIYYDRRLQKVS